MTYFTEDFFNGLRRGVAALGFAALIAFAAAPLAKATPEQGWAWPEAHWWHHASQGTMFMPYRWFLALETHAGRSLLSSDGVLVDGFGFLASPATETNPDGLPIGFSRTPRKFGPGAGLSWVGITCAGCHTGRIDYRGARIIIQGGPARANFKAFRDGLFAAILANRCDVAGFRRRAVTVRKAVLKAVPIAQRDRLRTAFQQAEQSIVAQVYPACQSDPQKYLRFLNRIEPSHDIVAKESARAAYEGYLDHAIAAGLRRTYGVVIAGARLDAAGAGYGPITPPGPGRIDALMRGGNRLFADLLQEPLNFHPETGPVSLPPLWDAAHLTWLLYNGAGKHPLARSIIEALGVGAALYLSSDPDRQQVDFATVRAAVTAAQDARRDKTGAGGYLRGLDGMAGRTEAILPALDAIQTTLEDLRSPVWPERVLGPIGRGEDWRAGRDLYRKYCLRCHRLIDRAGPFPDGVPVTFQPLADIGTDPEMAVNFATRRVSSARNNFRDRSVPEMVTLVTDLVIERYVDDTGLASRDLARMTRGEPNQWVAERRYRARPLNGVWATAPFLHNGSVPNLFELLKPSAERKSFCQGDWEFDPVNVGLAARETCTNPRTPLFDTSIRGNSNAGHDGRDYLADELRISEAKRRQLILFLKSL